MAETILLIDYENVKDTGLKDLPPHNRVQLFVGKEQKPKISFIQEQLAQQARLDMIQVAEQGRNNLDFYIAFYLGKIMSEEPNAHYIVFSNDQDLDPLLAHLQKRGVNCSRIGPARASRTPARAPAVAAQKTETPRPVERRATPRVAAAKPTAAPPAANSAGQLQEALNFLKRSGKRRPTTLKKLINTLESHLQIKPLEAGKLIRLLDQSGVLSLTPAGAVSYKI